MTLDIVDRLKQSIARKSDLDRDKDLMCAALREIERLRRKAPPLTTDEPRR